MQAFDKGAFHSGTPPPPFNMALQSAAAQTGAALGGGYGAPYMPMVPHQSHSTQILHHPMSQVRSASLSLDCDDDFSSLICSDRFISFFMVAVCFYCCCKINAHGTSYHCFSAQPGPSRATAAPGETFLRGPQTFSWGPSGEKIFEFFSKWYILVYFIFLADGGAPQTSRGSR